MPAVFSSAISRIEYDAGTHVLSIWFRSAKRYDYYGVPISVYTAFLNAPSKGRYYDSYIKDRY
ncbi:KTSC domain-containing protein [Gluconacetobacter entanii]|uniref:KTSC domain-containing protein n=1 Tax=Gluconacetobacter entanii TaxID=108528 RepID=UPI0014943302|nr:KTSC domain-containing protein [Komagataeibacter sp. FXV2]MBY4639236.1 KTSC domain-containing protein [Gluconacetobacter entanii]NPC90654.1 KTSC domain-containing protein [Gluconacetobacter entanii]